MAMLRIAHFRTVGADNEVISGSAEQLLPAVTEVHAGQQR